jgi:phenylacetate-CoA ligase
LWRHLGWSSDRLLQRQDRQLREILSWAYDRVPFYREKYDRAGVSPYEVNKVEDLQRLPVTERHEIRGKDLSSFFARGYNPSECFLRLTSGSTGIPVTRAFTKDEIALRSALSRRIFLIYGLYPNLRNLVVGDPRAWSPPWYQRSGIYRERHISAFTKQDEQADIYRSYSPDILSGYPSSLRLLGETLRRHDIPFPKPRIILTVGELLLPATSFFLEEVFSAPIRDRYGIEEMGYIAWECPVGGGYHVAADCGIFEVLDENNCAVEPGKEGDLILTSLYTRAMPLIRYRLGDLVSIEPDPCPCGCSFPRIRRITGRADDLLRLPSGEWVHPVVAAWGVVDIPGMELFRITQKGIREYQVDLVTQQPLTTETQSNIQKHFKTRLGAEKVTVNRVKEISPDPSGKFRHIIYEAGQGSKAGSKDNIGEKDG